MAIKFSCKKLREHCNFDRYSLSGIRFFVYFQPSSPRKCPMNEPIQSGSATRFRLLMPSVPIKYESLP
ncbi:MAG TPA: hypothetical protein DIC22_02740 [Chitinophagaceae bacterium]|nr:hypothetical protein [Chitinophagaceae bacterium]